MTIESYVQGKWMGFGERFAILSKISAESSPFDPQGATLCCVLPVEPDESYQGGFAPVVKKSAQDFLDESLLFIETEEFRGFYRTSGRTDVAVRTSSASLDGHGKDASEPWRAPPIPWNSTSACMRYRQHSVSSHATPLHDVTASSLAATCNMLANAMTFGGSLHHVAMQGAHFLASALRSYAVLLIGAIQLRPFYA